MSRTPIRIAPREGYDRWSRTYDDTDSSLVALDRRETLKILRPRPGQRILDAGCGTGAHLTDLGRSDVRVVGIDFSAGMLGVARQQNRDALLIQADLNRRLPLVTESFDAVLCTLVSEHLSDIGRFFVEIHRVLRPGGRLVFSAFHPDLAIAGVEANFVQDGMEYRLGAELYSVEDYHRGLTGAGLDLLSSDEFVCDDALAREVSSASKRLGQKLLLLIQARRPGESVP